MSAFPVDYKRTKLACYTAYFTMSSVFCLPPLLFVTFHETYGISYTLLGTLILVNFVTQLAVDLLFTLFSRRFPTQKIVRIMPLITSLGLLLYAIIPWVFPQLAYAGMVAGTVIFSLSAGLSEVLLSPTIAAIPSENPQRDMSMLHSLYAFGVLTVVAVSSLFLHLFGTENWMYLTMFLACLPVLAAVLFYSSPMPDMTPQEAAGSAGGARRRTVGIALCAACIFFGSCAENAMSNWVSGYMEKALNMNKTLGDILGMAMFAVLLGIARISYAKWGKRIAPILLTGMIGAVGCYLVAGLCSNAVVALIACVLTGLFTSMLWPGSLILMEENIPGAGVAAFALMAASGDLGASIAPQLLGAVTDAVAASPLAAQLSATGIAPEQLGMRIGMLVCALFPIIGTGVVIAAVVHFRKKKPVDAEPAQL